MATTPPDPTTAMTGRPPVVDLATWQVARDELLVREKAHTREGDTQPWYSVRGVAAPIGGEMGHIASFLRDGDRVFLTYSTTGRGKGRSTGP